MRKNPLIIVQNEWIKLLRLKKKIAINQLKFDQLMKDDLIKPEIEKSNVRFSTKMEDLNDNDETFPKIGEIPFDKLNINLDPIQRTMKARCYFDINGTKTKFCDLKKKRCKELGNEMPPKRN